MCSDVFLSPCYVLFIFQCFVYRQLLSPFSHKIGSFGFVSERNEQKSRPEPFRFFPFSFFNSFIYLDLRISDILEHMAQVLSLAREKPKDDFA